MLVAMYHSQRVLSENERDTVTGFRTCLHSQPQPGSFAVKPSELTPWSNLASRADNFIWILTIEMKKDSVMMLLTIIWIYIIVCVCVCVSVSVCVSFNWVSSMDEDIYLQ